MQTMPDEGRPDGVSVWTLGLTFGDRLCSEQVTTVARVRARTDVAAGEPTGPVLGLCLRLPARSGRVAQLVKITRLRHVVSDRFDCIAQVEPVKVKA